MLDALGRRNSQALVAFYVSGKGPQELENSSPRTHSKIQHTKAWEMHIEMLKKDLLVTECTTDSAAGVTVEDN